MSNDEPTRITMATDEAMQNRAALECVALIQTGKATIERGPGGMVAVKFNEPTSIAGQSPQNGCFFFDGHPAFDGIEA